MRLYMWCWGILRSSVSARLMIDITHLSVLLLASFFFFILPLFQIDITVSSILNVLEGAKAPNLNLVIRKHQTTWHLRTFYNITGLYSAEMSKLWYVRDRKRHRLRNCYRLKKTERQDNDMQITILNFLLQ